MEPPSRNRPGRVSPHGGKACRVTLCISGKWSRNNRHAKTMIPNHPRFVEAILESKKVKVNYYSAPDSGVVDRICAPLDYGPGAGGGDGVNRYWLLEYSSTQATRVVGLVPDQIVDLKVLGETFNPVALGVAAWPWAIERHPQDTRAVH